MENVSLAKIALAVATYAIDKPFDYLLPQELAQRVQPGMRAMVPFGAGNRRAEGIILAVRMGPKQERIKTVLALLDEQPVLDNEGIQLALWMRERYFCTVYDAVRAMLPTGLYFALQDCWCVAPGINRELAYAAAGRSENAKQLLDLIFASDGKAELGQIRAAFGTRDPNPVLKQLTDAGILVMETSALRNVADKTEAIATLAMPPEEAMALVMPKRKTAPLRYAVTELLATLGCAPAKELCYFTGAASATLRSLEKSGILTLEKQEKLRRVETAPVAPAAPVVLNEEQQRAFDGLNRLLVVEKSAAALLYGVTGSGKTLVYIKLISEVLSRGKTALVLVPEIALTPQLFRIFKSHFGEQVAVLHSSLRSGERYDEWKRIRSGAAQVVLGTRSAVFAPLKDLGLMILDEEQEYTYKSENVPRYHARDVAKFRCARSEALLLLGSATPSVESMYCARSGAYHLFTLTQRYNQRPLPPVILSDRRADLRAGNGAVIGQVLRRELEANLAAGEQTILFLNRRGASRMSICRECGAVPSCPRCSVYLTYHSANRRMMCHYCGHSEPLPETCPSCGGALDFVGAGTQKVQEELERLFPGVEIMRMDADTVSASNSHEKLLSRFRSERVPILIGTQMVAKGLDFENVTLVGVVDADLSLYVDDYRAGERTFSLLTQVVGRAGRGALGGRAVIQTFTPENEIITAAAAQDYDTFYQQEIDLRRLRNCPPYGSLFVFTASGVEEGSVLRACMRLRQGLEQWLSRPDYSGLWQQLLGPAPASVAKVNNRYRYRLVLNGHNCRAMRELMAYLLRMAQMDKENKGVSVFGDIDPLD